MGVFDKVLEWVHESLEKEAKQFPPDSPVCVGFSSSGKIVKILREFKEPEKLNEELDKLKGVLDELDLTEKVVGACQNIGALIDVPDFSSVKSFIIELSESQVDQISVDILVLRKKMKLLNEKVDANYNSLKSYFVEHEFFTSTILPVGALMKDMRYALKHNTQEAMDTYTTNYDDLNPRMLIRNIAERLNHEVTNPILAAMKADERRSKNTLHMWLTCFDNLFSSLHILYCFYEGLNWRTAAQSGQMYDAVTDARNELQTFIDRYEVDYWPNCVTTLMRETAENNTDKSNQAKADILKRKLEKIATEHKFVVLVYDSPPFGHQNHSFTAHNMNTYENAFRHAGCCIVVSRSRFYKGSARDLELDEEMADQLQDILPNHIYNHPKEGMSEDVGHLLNSIKNAGFVGVVKKSLNVGVATVGVEEGYWCHYPKCVNRAADDKSWFSTRTEDTFDDLLLVVAPK